MAVNMPKFTLEDGLDLRQLQSSGSVLHINEHYDDYEEIPEYMRSDSKTVDFIGGPIKDFSLLVEKLTNVDLDGFVKKKVLEEGGGLPLDERFTVTIAYSGYCENENEPFDVVSLRKPLEVNLRDHGLLPGLDIAVKSMLVGEMSLFLFSYKVMYGELGIPPRIKPKAQCAFFIKLCKSTLTPQGGKLNLSEPNIFDRVLKEVKLLYSAGMQLYEANSLPPAIRAFKKAEFMLHKCRLADEKEEMVQEKFLKKLYINLTLCYIKSDLPYKACIACNELARLKGLWNNEKALYQNAKALRMIGSFNAAEKRLKKAMKLNPNRKEIVAEMELLIKTRDSCNKSKLTSREILKSGILSDEFKKEIDTLINNFKENVNLCKLTMPSKLSSCEMRYVKEACVRENLFFNKVPNSVMEEVDDDGNKIDIETTFALEKEAAHSEKSEES